jgi:trehalose 6-phosphate phosphatase
MEKEMPSVAVSGPELRAFFEKLGKAKQRVLLLDYDGTLAPFCADRLGAVPYPGVAERLHSIITAGTRTRLALITGRPVAELKSLISLSPTPEIWGAHGLERLRPDGSYEMPEIPAVAAKLLAGIQKSLKAEGLEPIMERKPGSIALHWRALSKEQARDVRERTMKIWTAIPEQPILYLAEFDGGLEFRLHLRNKGDAVREIVSELPDDVPIAYLGDDRTDEDAFRALKGHGLSVLVRGEYRPTEADSWIRPPQGLLDFLTEWLQACREREA